jgi:hypothetical protein
MLKQVRDKVGAKIMLMVIVMATDMILPRRLSNRHRLKST